MQIDLQALLICIWHNKNTELGNQKLQSKITGLV